MRKLRVFEHISLDGVIQSSSEDNFPYADWTAPYRSPNGGEKVLSLMGENFDLLLGRKTYDIWAAYWPNAPKMPMSDRLNAATKYVVTHRPETLNWGPVQGLNGLKDFKQIKEKNGSDIILWGSSTLTSKLLEQGLVDEVVTLVYPVLVGAGKRFFAEGTPACQLTLENSQAMSSGIIVNTYQYSGLLQK